MKHIAMGLIMTAALLALTAPAANALSVYGTWWKTSDDDAFGVTLQHRQNLTPLFSLDGRVGWLTFSDTKADIFPLELAALAKLGIFYAGPGVGYYVFSGDADLDNDFGYFLLGGVRLGLGALGVYGEAKYGFLKTDFNFPGGGSAEADLDYFALHAGVFIGI